MRDLADLIARLEVATGPDREMDGLIFMATLPPDRRRPTDWRVLPDTGQIYAWNAPPPHAPGTGGVWASAPAFTASLDAALTLLPEGWVLRSIEFDGQRYTVALFCPVNPWLGAPHRGQHQRITHALCIAALRAREVGDAR